MGNQRPDEEPEEMQAAEAEPDAQKAAEPQKKHRKGKKHKVTDAFGGKEQRVEEQREETQAAEAGQKREPEWAKAAKRLMAGADDPSIYLAPPVSISDDPSIYVTKKNTDKKNT